MAVAAYEAGRPKGSSRPEFERCSSEWQEAMCREMAAAIVAAEADGFMISQPRASYPEDTGIAGR